MTKSSNKKLAVINADIHTMNKDTLSAGSMLISSNGKIEEVSSESFPTSYDSGGVDVFDANGKTIIPGFIDAHIHLVDGGVFKSRLNLRECGSIDEMRTSLKDYSSSTNQEWVIGYGFTDSMFDNKRLNKHLIDEIESDKPVVLIKSCGHSALLNSKAIREIPLNELFTDDEYNQLIEKDNEAQLTGVFFETAYRKVIDFVEKKYGLDYETVITDTIDYLLSQGITTIYDNTFHKNIYDIYRTLKSENRLRFRIQSWLYGYDNDKRDELLPYALSGDDMLNVVGSKYFLDGSITSTSAYLRSPYSTSENNRGMLLIDPDTLFEQIKKDVKANLQPIAHCIGDGAIDLYLNIIDRLYGEAEIKSQLKNNRPRIEHSTILAPDLLDRLKYIKPVITYQQGELNDKIVEMYRMKLGEDRIKHLDEVRFMLDNDIPVAFSSDWPYINPPKPLASLESYRSRNDDVSLYELISIYTKGNAYAGRLESNIGVLSKGFNADFIVLSENPFKDKHLPLSEIDIQHTFVNGRSVYQR